MGFPSILEDPIFFQHPSSKTKLDRDWENNHKLFVKNSFLHVQDEVLSRFQLGWVGSFSGESFHHRLFLEAYSNVFFWGPDKGSNT